MTPWRYACASVIGTSHIKSGAPCQDASLCEIVPGRDGTSYVVAIVSDGAGSAKYAEVGSKIATECVFDEIRTYLSSGNSLSKVTLEIAIAWARAARTEIESTAHSAGATTRDYACTLLAAVVGDTTSVFFQIGDGAIVVGVEYDDWAYLFWPQHGEYANTTHFLTENEFEKSLGFEYSTNPVEEFAVFSDGIERLVLDYAQKSVHAPFFEKMATVMRNSSIFGEDKPLSDGLSRYLSSPAICERTDDDKSLILVTRRSTRPSDEQNAS